MGCLFGTDGVRGKAGTYPLDPPTVRRLGAALARGLAPDFARVTAGAGPKFLSGRDTRESGGWIERELAFGISSQGGSLTGAGIIPTPAGIKVFSGAGEKFTEQLEQHVEAIMADASWQVRGGDAPAVEQVDYRAEYVSHLRAILPNLESGTRLVVDCANGATTTIAPRLFQDLGFHVRCIGCEPDGRNINLKCGSTAPEQLARAVVDGDYPLGIAYDGDGDRAIFVDETGRVVDGDAVMLMCAKQMKREGRLRGNAIVATVMSNIGLEIALRDAGIDLVRCPVGDKYVMEEMLRRNLALGGEQSGHIIFSEYLFTGDGLATSLNVLRTIGATGRTLSDLASDLTTYPQVLVNVRVDRKVDLQTVPEVAQVMSAVESKLAGNGRLLIRYSGTEPLLRIMIEGQDQREISAWADEIADAVKRHLVVTV